MNEENINYQGNQNVGGVPPQQPIPQNQGVVEQPQVQVSVAQPQVQVAQSEQAFGAAPVQQDPMPAPVEQPIQQPVQQAPMPAPAPQIVQQPAFEQQVQPQVFEQPIQQPLVQPQVQQVAPPPVAPPPPVQVPNNGTYAPSGPVNGIDNIGFIAVGQPIKKKKNKGLLIFIGLVITVLLGLLVYFVAFPFVIKTFLNDPKNVYDVTITNLSKSINTSIDTVFYDKAIYSIGVDLDTNIDGLETFSGYNYSARIGIDPELETLEYGYGIKDKYDKDYAYSTYIKNGRVYERYSTYDGLLFLGDTTDEANDELKDLFDDYKEFIEKYGQNNTSYLYNKLAVLFIESIDENKLVKEDASISINNKVIKTINNKYLLDKENIKRTRKYILEGLMNDEKALEIISDLEGTTISELKVQMMEEIDKAVGDEEELVLSIYTYGTNSEVVGLELQQAKDFKIQHFFKDGNFNTFIYVKSIVNQETTEKTYNIDGVKVGNVTNVTMMSDNKKYITLKITDLENGKSIDYNVHEEFFADEYNAQAVTTVAGNLTYKNDVNDKRNKYTIDFSIKNKDDYLKTSIIFNIDWNSDVANINTADIATVDRYTVSQAFKNQVSERTPLGMVMLLFESN